MHRTWKKKSCYLINIKHQVNYKSWIRRTRPVVIRIKPYTFSDTSWSDTSCVCSKVRFYSTTTKLIQISSRDKLIITYSDLVYSKTISELFITIATFSEAEGYGFNAQGRKKYILSFDELYHFLIKMFQWNKSCVNNVKKYYVQFNVIIY